MTYRVNIHGGTFHEHHPQFLKDESGATAIEYGLIAALVSVAIIAMLSLLGNNLNATFKAVADNLEAASEPSALWVAGIGGRSDRRCRDSSERVAAARRHGSGG